MPAPGQAARGAEADAEPGEGAGAGGDGDAGEVGIGDAGAREQFGERRKEALGLAGRHVLDEGFDVPSSRSSASCSRGAAVSMARRVLMGER